MTRTPVRRPPLAERAAELRRLAKNGHWNDLGRDQVAALLIDDWSGAGPLRFTDTLTLRELRGSVMLRNVRALLRLAGRRGSIPEVVASPAPFRLEQTAPLPGFCRRVRTGLRLASGPLVDPLYWTEGLMVAAGLIGPVPGGFTLRPLGSELLAPRHAGRLYAHLFRTYFRVFDIAYIDPFPSMPVIQDLVPYWLAILMDHVPAALRADYFVQVFTPDPVRLDAAAAPARLRALVQTRVFDALADFGLMEVVAGDDRQVELGDVRFRATPLFARFLRLELPPSESRLWRRHLSLLR